MNERELFGGALTALVPTSFADASQFRQVPDTQEVFVDDGPAEESLIFDILEKISDADDSAIKTHFGEIVAINGGASEILTSGQLQGANYPTWTCLGEQETKKWGKEEETLTKVTICVALVRLEKVSTDIVISYNVIQGERQQEGYERLQEIAKSFKVKDWDLFG